LKVSVLKVGERIETMFMPRKILEEKLTSLLTEDVGLGDVTSAAVVPSGLQVEAEVIAKEEGIIAGIEEVKVLAESLGLNVTKEIEDGELVKSMQRALRISGDARTILSAERTMLNLLCRMSGIATETRRIMKILAGAKSKVKVAGTRKSPPGLLYFDKKAVFVGGGDPHRFHLDDMVLLKDNHVAIVGDAAVAVKKAKLNASFSKKVEVEITKVEDVIGVAEAGADIIMFDNFSPKQIMTAVGLLKKAKLYGKVLLEASGGINAENIAEYGSTPIDFISMGALTHSSKALDMSMEIKPPEEPRKD
jgi:nicotinate-nucleotide pyrophosphorylase (carboxylating)